MLLLKNDLERRIADDSGCSYKDMSIIMDSFIKVLRNCIINQDTVKLVDLFTIEVKKWKGRKRLDLKTKQKIYGKDYHQVYIRVSTVLVEEMRKKAREVEING